MKAEGGACSERLSINLENLHSPVFERAEQLLHRSLDLGVCTRVRHGGGFTVRRPDGPHPRLKSLFPPLFSPAASCRRSALRHGVVHHREGLA